MAADYTIDKEGQHAAKALQRQHGKGQEQVGQRSWMRTRQGSRSSHLGIITLLIAQCLCSSNVSNILIAE